MLRALSILFAFALIVGVAKAQLVMPGGNANGGTPGGAAGGDLSGTYPNPTVAKLNGVAPGTGVAAALGNQTNKIGGMSLVGSIVPINVVLANKAITGTTSFVMYGYGMSFTPSRSGTVLVLGSFRAVGTAQSASAGDDYAFYYGTGTAPANGAAATGTQAFAINGSTPNGAINFYSMLGAITGLTVGTPYWFDLAGLLGTGSATMQLLEPTFLLVEQ